MKEAKKTIRRYAGLKKIWKIVIAASVATGVILSALSLICGRQPEPEPVPFDPLTAAKNDYCYFDAVGISPMLYRVKSESGSYTTVDTYFIAENAAGYRIIVNLDRETQRGTFAQQIYFGGGSLGGAPKPYRLKGLAFPVRQGSSIRKEIARTLGIDAGGEYEQYFGSVILNAGRSPKRTGAGKLEAYALLAGVTAFFVFMGNMGTLSMMWACFKDLKKYGRLETAAEWVAKGDGSAPAIIGDGYVFMKNKGVALCPEMVKEALCTGTRVSLKTRRDLKPTVLHFSGPEQARRFMDFIPLACVRDDEVMILTDSPEKYGCDD